MSKSTFYYIDKPSGDVYRVTKWWPELDQFRMGLYHVGAHVECVKNVSGQACLQSVIEPSGDFIEIIEEE